MLRGVFQLSLRQTEGLRGSVFELMGVDPPVPDHTTVYLRAMTLPLISLGRLPDGCLTYSDR